MRDSRMSDSGPRGWENYRADLPTCAESERDTATDAPAAIAYVKRLGLADEGAIFEALGIGG